MAKSQARKTPTRKPAAKKAKAQKRPAKKGASTKSADRIDKLVEAQKATIKRVSDFVGNVAGLTAKGNFAPGAWMKHYTTLLEGLSDDLANATKALLKD